MHSQMVKKLDNYGGIAYGKENETTLSVNKNITEKRDEKKAEGQTITQREES